MDANTARWIRTANRLGLTVTEDANLGTVLTGANGVVTIREHANEDGTTDTWCHRRYPGGCGVPVSARKMAATLREIA